MFRKSHAVALSYILVLYIISAVTVGNCMNTSIEMDLQKAKEIVEVLKPIYYDVRLWRYTALQQKEKQMRLGVLCEYHTCMMDGRVTQKDCLRLKAIREKKTLRKLIYHNDTLFNRYHCQIYRNRSRTCCP